MLELKELKELHDKAYNNNQITRERASDDMVFANITQWDDNLLGESQLAYRGEFNILRKARRQIVGDLRANPIQVDFQPKSETRDDGADLLDGMYRSDDRVNTSLESYDNASQEAVDCGIGGWELTTEYESNRAGNRNQIIKRMPVYEFNNNAFPDPNARLLDKSDSNYWSILVRYSVDGYKNLVKELTGEEDYEVAMSSFKQPEESYAFPWAAGQSKIIYVVRFYHREKVKDTVYTFKDPFGGELLIRKSDIQEIEDELIDEGYEIVAEKTIKRWEITLYIASGERILKSYTIPGEYLPVIPTYGERAWVEGEEHYEGITRLAKDPQRLRNFQMSYLADIVSRSPRPKPIFFPEQLGKHRYMYEESGADNNFPYYFQERFDASGRELPIGPVAQMPEQKMPQSLIASIQLSREAVSDVAPANITSEIADVDLSGKAVQEMQRRLDDQSIVFQQNLKHAKRRDAEIYASMASVIYDAPRDVLLTLPDGKQKTERIMESVMDEETGEMVVINDLTNSEFNVYAEIGPNYTTKREETFQMLGGMAEQMAIFDPQMAKELRLQQLTLVDGIAMENVRANARKQQVISGFIEPDTDEEKELLEQSQQNQQPDANMALAMAEQGKADAAMAREQNTAQRDAAKAQNDQEQTQIDVFKAQTDRFNMQVDAEKAGAEIDFKRSQTFANKMKVANESFRARVS